MRACEIRITIWLDGVFRFTKFRFALTCFIVMNSEFSYPLICSLACMRSVYCSNQVVDCSVGVCRVRSGSPHIRSKCKFCISGHLPAASQCRVASYASIRTRSIHMRNVQGIRVYCLRAAGSLKASVLTVPESRNPPSLRTIARDVRAPRPRRALPKQ